MTFIPIILRSAQSPLLCFQGAAAQDTNEESLPGQNSATSLKDQVIDLIENRQSEKALNLLLNNKDKLPANIEEFLELMNDIAVLLYERGYDEELDNLMETFDLSLTLKNDSVALTYG